MSAEFETKSPVDEVYLKTTQVRQRYGNCSEMWIIRRIKDAGFQTPVYFGHLRFWRESDLREWERKQIAAPKARPACNMRVAREGKAVRQ